MSEIINIEKFYNHDTRIALLEKSVNDISCALVRLENKMDSGFDFINKKFDSIDRKFDSIDRKFDAIDKKIDSKFTWLLSLMIAQSTGILAVMAHGFHWV